MSALSSRKSLLALLGVLLLALARAELPVHEVTPAEIKKTVTGTGQAEDSAAIEARRLQSLLSGDGTDEGRNRGLVLQCLAIPADRQVADFTGTAAGPADEAAV